jgi:hypothetical protein
VQFKGTKLLPRSTGTFLHVASLHKGFQTAEVIPGRCFLRAFGVTVYLLCLPSLIQVCTSNISRRVINTLLSKYVHELSSKL